jgi:hypothetical protein
MTRLRIASQFLAMVAGAYAVLMLIDGQLIDFGVTAADQQCPLCGGACQKPSESTGFVDPQRTCSCGACAPAPDPELTR